MKARILWVEGKRTDSAVFVSSLEKKEYGVEIAPTGNAAIARLVELDPDLVVVNAASFRSSGKRICNEIREKSARLPIVLIVAALIAVVPAASVVSVVTPLTLPTKVVVPLPLTVRLLPPPATVEARVTFVPVSVVFTPNVKASL